MEEQLNELKRLIHNSTTVESLQKVEDKDVTVFMGNTKSGKSTVVNYVLGNPLKSERDSKKYRINHASTEYTGPTIGVKSTSETTLPTVWTSTRITGLIVDAPGFDDNRGEAQDIANVYHIRNILTSAKSAKIVLVLDINDITGDNVGQFISLVDKVKTMFPNVGQNLNPVITFVLTKDRDKTTKSDVCEYFDKKILSQPLLKVDNRELVEYLSKNPNHIVLIRMPDSERNLSTDDEVFEELVSAISNSSKLEKSFLRNINFGLSDKSKAFLYKTSSNLTEDQDFENSLDNSFNMFKQNLCNHNQAFANIADGKKVENKLRALREKISKKSENNPNALELLKALNELIPGNRELNLVIYNRIRFLTFVQEILEIACAGVIQSKIQLTFSKMQTETNNTIANVQQRMKQLKDESVENVRKNTDNFQSTLSCLKTSCEIVKTGFDLYKSVTGESVSANQASTSSPLTNTIRTISGNSDGRQASQGVDNGLSSLARIAVNNVMPLMWPLDSK